jgi:uncharacterized membrane protein
MSGTVGRPGASLIDLVQDRRLSPWIMGVLVLLPLTSAVASYCGNRSALITIYLLIAAVVMLVTLVGKHDDRFFTWVILSIALSLLLSAVFTSQYLRGYDIHDEYRIFMSVSQTGHWNPEYSELYNSVLSISVLPTIIALVAAVDAVTILKLMFPLIFSLVPVVLYRVYRTLLPAPVAFLSVFLFMAYPTFYDEMIQLGRQEVAELLFVLLLWLFLSRYVRSFAGGFAAFILTVGLVTSHYSMAVIYSLVLGFSLIISKLTRRAKALCSGQTALLALGLVLAWYVFAAKGTAIVSLTNVITSVVRATVQDFFSSSGRPLIVLQAAGAVGGVPGLLHDINRMTQYLVQACLLFGFMAFALKNRKSVIEKEMTPVMGVALVFLGCAVVLPYFAASLQLSRMYHIVLLLASPCFVYGARWIEQWIRAGVSVLRKFPSISRYPSGKETFLAAILVCYFLFVSGWAWAVTMDRPTSYVIDSERMSTSQDLSLKASYHNDYLALADISGAKWLNTHYAGNLGICSDATTMLHVLTSYGGFAPWPSQTARSLPFECDFSSSYVFLSEFNTLHGELIGTTNPSSFPTSLLDNKLSATSRIFSDGGAAIYI